MRKARFKVVFNRKKRLNKDGNALVQIRVYLSRELNWYVTTGIYVRPEMWDTKNSEVSGQHPSAIYFNKQIQDKLAELTEFQFDLNKKGREMSVSSVQQFKGTGTTEITFNRFYKSEMLKDNSVSLSTRQTRNQTLDKLNDFNPSIRFTDIDQLFVDEFTAFLVDKGLGRNTITKHFKHFKKYLNLAIDYKEFSFDQYRSLKFRIKYKSKRKVYLSYSDLAKIDKLDLSEYPRIEVSRLAFLLSCYSGLRASDCLPLTKRKLQFMDHGVSIDIHEMYKTEDPVYVPIYNLFNGEGERVLNKLLTMSDKKWPLVLPRKISNPMINEDLKIIQAAAGITKHLTMHVARHTFCTLLAYESKDPFMVMKYAGIRKVETAMGYIHLAKELGDSDLDRINWRNSD